MRIDILGDELIEPSGSEKTSDVEWRQLRLRRQTESRYVQTKMNAQGDVVRSKLNGLETPMNARKSGNRHFRTPESLDIGNFDHTKL